VAEGREFVGNRFRASVSPSGRQADLNDRKTSGKLTLLKRRDVADLARWLDTLVEKGKTENVVLSRPEFREKISGLNPEDVRELRELAGKLLFVMADWPGWEPS
jgi:hypothetical protein